MNTIATIRRILYLIVIILIVYQFACLLFSCSPQKDGFRNKAMPGEICARVIKINRQIKGFGYNYLVVTEKNDTLRRQGKTWFEPGEWIIVYNK